MNSIHNVTVSSPPSSASRERSVSLVEVNEVKASNHRRTRTRTIPPEDSIFTKIEQIQATPVVVKEPVAFEINFEEPKKPKVVVKEPEIEDSYDYESDFESYESDFEDEVESSSEQEQDENDVENDEENEVKVDSGNETMKKTSASSHFESIDDTINSHDSGFSYDRSASPKNQEIFKRGREIMKKVVFDTMNYDIFEMIPLPYDTFMAIYGDRGMSQASTQIDTLQVADEVQTDDIEVSEKWIQCPARFTKTGLECVKSKIYNEEKLGVGEGIIEKILSKENDYLDEFSTLVDEINNFSKHNDDPFQPTTSFDSHGYRNFLDTTELFISRALEKNDLMKNLQPSQISLCDGFYNLEYEKFKILSNTRVKNIYCNQKTHGFFITIHEKITENCVNILCLWDLLNSNRPLKCFVSWSEICCVEVMENQKDLIVGGCKDGTISIWDAAEFIEWIDDESSAIKQCEIVSANENLNADEIVAMKNLSYPNFRALENQPKTSQFCSIHQSGIVIMWSVAKIVDDEKLILSGKFKNFNMDFLHLKSRVRLLKNIVIDLNSQPKEMSAKMKRKKSAFEKTRYYFENDLFNDKALQELQEINTSPTGKTQNDIPHFSICDASFNEIFAASDLNYILAISRLNFIDSRKIFTSDFNSNSITAMKIHPMETNVMAIGHLNGEVKFMKIFNSHEKSLKMKKKLERSSKVDLDEMENHKDLKVSFEKNIFNTFAMLTGAIQVIEFDRKGEFMFMIVGRQLKIFNCWKNCEIECQDNLDLKGLKCATSSDGHEFLVRF